MNAIRASAEFQQPLAGGLACGMSGRAATITTTTITVTISPVRPVVFA